MNTEVRAQQLASLPKPDPTSIRDACEQFERDNRLDEAALRQLWTLLPHNTKSPAVLLKIIALDRLYGTRLLSTEIRPLAKHIAASDIDALLAQGAIEAFDIVLAGPQGRSFYSFATKFCSWHNPAAYPIWDSYVDDALWLYKQKFPFTNATRKELWTYSGFRRGLDMFRDYFGLQTFTYREIDKFLWSVGYTLRDQDQETAVALPPTPINR